MKVIQSNMKIKLHEIELNSTNVESNKEFYNNLLGLPLNVDNENIKVFQSGFQGLDLNISNHFSNKLSISFLVDDIEEFAKYLIEKGINISEIKDAHLGLRTFTLTDPDGRRIEIQSPTELSPQWLREMI